MGGFCPGGFVQGDFVRGDFVLGGFCPGGFCPRTDFWALVPFETTIILTNFLDRQGLFCSVVGWISCSIPTINTERPPTFDCIIPATDHFTPTI